MDPDFRTLVFDIKLKDILVGAENNEEHIKIENIKQEYFEVEENMSDANEAKIKEEPLDIKDNHPYIKTENCPILSSFDHMYAKTQDGPYLKFLEHDHCYCRGKVGVTKVKRVQKIHYPYKAKDIFRSPVESFNGMMIRLESNVRDEILASKTRLPFQVVDILNSPVDSFNMLMNHPELSPEQVKVCHDIRRRGCRTRLANKVDTRNCKEREMDTIDELHRQLEHLEQVDLLS